MKPAVDSQVFETVSAYTKWRQKLHAERPQATVGFVPTMGALHEGHAALLRTARQECDYVVTSIFVNPLQFGPHEDLDRYPRTFGADLELCREIGVDAVFHPGVVEIYPKPLDLVTKVTPPLHLIKHLDGAFRPGHFEGVATVVLKLFSIVAPTTSYFGEKDYQQLTVIRTMVADLNLPLRIVGVPTVREKDGLALSSRNVYLDEKQRQLAPRLQQVLAEVAKQCQGGKPLLQALAEGAAGISELPGVDLQYLQACHAQTLEPLTEFARPAVILLAAKFGNVRLIDNVIIV